MAAIAITLGYRAAASVPVLQTLDLEGEVVTSSAASAQSTLVAKANQYWEISPAGDVWVDFGTNPTAAAGDKVKIWAGTTRHFQAKAGDKVAVIDA